MQINWQKDIRTIKWLFMTVKGFKLKSLAIYFMGLVRLLVGLYSIWVTKTVIDIATHKTDDNMYFYLGLMVALMVAQLVIGVCYTWMDGIIRLNYNNKIRYHFFTRVMQSPWTGKDRMHTGDVVNRLSGDLGTIADFACGTIPAFLLTLTQLIAASTMLYVLQRELLWVILLVMPVTALLSRIYVLTMRRLNRQLRENSSRMLSHLQDSVQNRIILIALGGIRQSFDKLLSIQSQLVSLTKQQMRFSIFSGTLVRVGFTAGYTIAFVWGVLGIRSGAVTFGTMTAFLQLVSQVQGPFADMAAHIPAFIHVVTSSERIMELLPVGKQSILSDEEVPIEGPIGIRVKDLSFSYVNESSNQTRVLTNVNLDFRPGTRTAIVGETGIGKSTLIRLILSLLDTDKGSITLYNDMGEWASDEHTRCNFSMVPQGNSLFSGTIRENLLIGNPEATEEQMHEALTTAAAEFVFTLPRGLDTNCTERGAGLSEGQAQRIAIARAFLHRGSILIMDEASSALDEETEQRIIDRLSARKDKTILWITHHRAVAEALDAIVRL
ncbi:MAG: ABC transporter ATP-binding protein/permease [Bacteroidaceae bacterium]|nr:ABC transporter ATP-binding protein/permease [Bacteroidaceae bacterium]